MESTAVCQWVTLLVHHVGLCLLFTSYNSKNILFIVLYQHPTPSLIAISLNRQSSSSTSTLEFTAFSSDSRSSVRSFLTRIKTEVALSFTISGTSQEEDVLSSWGKLGQLIESQSGSLGSLDSLSGSSGESESSDLKSLWDIQESDIIGDCSNDGDDAWVVFGFSLCDGCLIIAEMSSNAWDGDGIAGESGLIKTFMDDLIELGFGSSAEEGVELDYFRLTLIKLFK